MDVSVVIPAYNAASTIGRQLDSLACQTFDGSWEVIVANNGSKDETVRVIESFKSRFPVPLSLVDASKTQGAAHARNSGVLVARGKFVAFCDADDRVEPDWLDTLVWALSSDVDVVGGFLEEYEDRVSDLDVTAIYEESENFRAPVHLGGNSAIRRHRFLELGGYDESFRTYGCEDYEFMIRARKARLRIAYVPSARIEFTPTTDFKNVLRKIYNSGKAEVRVWARHPDEFPGRNKLRSVILENFKSATHAVTGFRSNSLKGHARSGVTAAGHLVGVISGKYKGWDEPQFLIAPNK
ncbi:glycosyltransferase family 2 protein [Neomicrococcus lactis]|uniref:Glycosyltransferase involved in cell wall biosynthesis n=1 Tax=Neomicrococcus lactis TaxID=732241 RepID=A0A7W8YAY4_9MICC|nr:glycosyltransferase [Neomicrococcus lactis]MBB5598185.1 glycosyltransferase involved in cell wall biosynthesis [Neomicrococcus lactis]